MTAYAEPRFYTTAEAARLMGLSRSRLGHLIEDGRLVPTRSSPYLFTLKAIRDCLAAIKEPGNPNWRKPAESTA